MADEQTRIAYSPAEAARALGISERTMRSLIASSRVRVVRVGSRVLVPAGELRALLRNEGAEAVAAR
ncbi:MAG: helix-turn-helix domain-containing protein [Thermomicrobiales bacterium]